MFAGEGDDCLVEETDCCRIHLALALAKAKSLDDELLVLLIEMALLHLRPETTRLNA